MLIYPAIDILNGNVVRLEKGDFNSAVNYAEDIFSQAKIYSDSGLKAIHVVDLSGSKEGKINTVKVLERIKKETDLTIQFGGGIRSLNDISRLFSIGIDRIILGSMPILDKTEFENVVNHIAPDRIIIAADVIKNQVFIKGWSENSNIQLRDYMQSMILTGIRSFLITDVEKDGMLQGPNVGLYESLKSEYPESFIIASGGIKDLDDLIQLKNKEIDAAVIGKAIYEKRIDLKELFNFGK